MSGRCPYRESQEWGEKVTNADGGYRGRRNLSKSLRQKTSETKNRHFYQRRKRKPQCGKLRNLLLIAAAQFREQSQDFEIKPDERDHQAKGCVPLHVFRRPGAHAALDEIEIED